MGKLKQRIYRNSFKQFFVKRFFAFVDKRNTREHEHLLTLHNLYILPSRLGFYFLLMLSVVWLIGTNYQNNLILSLVFLLLSVFLIGILRTFSNLVGIKISYLRAEPVFASDEVFFQFKLESARKKKRESIELSWQFSNLEPVIVDLAPGESKVVKVPLKTQKRGKLKPSRLLIQTYFPLGMYRCWTWIRWEIDTVVYAKPISVERIASLATDEEGDGTHPTIGGDDYNGLHEYRPGDQLKHVAWKSYAKGLGLYTKEFGQSLSHELWLDYEATLGHDMESKLSGLTYWALEYHQMDEHYGLRLPGFSLEPNKGERHKNDVLTAIALHASQTVQVFEG